MLQELTSWTFAAQLVSTLAMVGLIWFVQLVHYPMFANVGPAQFAEYEQIHQQRTTWVVAPLMLTEFATGAVLLVTSYGDWQFLWYVCGACLLACIWISTAILQVPRHAALAAGYRQRDHQALVSTNWLRTAAWTARGLIVALLAVWQ